MKHTVYIPVEPSDYDEPGEVGFPEDSPSFFSPYDVPDGMEISYDGSRFAIKLTYIAYREPFSEQVIEVAGDLMLQLGKNSDRIIVISGECLPSVPEFLSEMTSINKEKANYYIAKCTLEDHWHEILKQAAILKGWISDPPSSSHSLR